MEIYHVDEIVNIEELSFNTPWSKDAFISELERNKCAKYRVILFDNKVVAYGGMWIVIDEAHITNIAVHPEYRGRGFGSEILNDLIETAKNNGILSMTLEVRTSNYKAIALYDKFGFKEKAIRKKYYQDTGEDAIIMWKHGLN